MDVNELLMRGVKAMPRLQAWPELPRQNGSIPEINVTTIDGQRFEAADVLGYDLDGGYVLLCVGEGDGEEVWLNMDTVVTLKVTG